MSAQTPTPIRRRGGTRRAASSGRPWPVFVGLGLVLGGGVASVEAFSLAGWSQVQILGLISTYGTVSGLLLAVWGVLAKVQDSISRLTDLVRMLARPAAPVVNLTGPRHAEPVTADKAAA